MNATRSALRLPEAAEIANLLADIMPVTRPSNRLGGSLPPSGPPSNGSASGRVPVAPPAAAGPAAPLPVSFTAGKALAAFNWDNAAQYRPPATAAPPEPELPLASRTFGAVLGMVNWDNDPTAARVPQPAYGGFDNLSPDWFDESAPTTNGRRAGEEWGVDRVMGQFVWE